VGIEARLPSGVTDLIRPRGTALSTSIRQRHALPVNGFRARLESRVRPSRPTATLTAGPTLTSAPEHRRSNGPTANDRRGFVGTPADATKNKVRPASTSRTYQSRRRAGPFISTNPGRTPNMHILVGAEFKSPHRCFAPVSCASGSPNWVGRSRPRRRGRQLRRILRIPLASLRLDLIARRADENLQFRQRPISWHAADMPQGIAATQAHEGQHAT
jgi:hypothetical protein